MQKKHIFTRETSGDLLLNEKLKKPFVSLSDEVTINNTLISYYRFTRTSKALNQPDLNLFCHVTGLIPGRPIFFFFILFLYFFRKSRCLFKKKIAYEAGIWEQIFKTGYCDVKHNMRIDRASKQMSFRQKRDVTHYSSVD